MATTSERLKELRACGDAPMDAAVAALSQEQRASLLSQLPVQARDDIAGLPPEIRPFFDEAIVPGLSDRDAALAERFFFEHGDIFLAATVTWAIPLFLCEMGRSGSVTGLPGEPDPVSARCLEMLQVVVDAFSINGLTRLAPHSRGPYALGRQRVIWALDRHALREGGWDEQRLGMPMGQTDMALWVLALMRTPDVALRQLSVPVRESSLTAWRVALSAAGAQMGISPELLPHEAAEIETLWTALTTLVAGEPHDGAHVIDNFIGLVERVMPGTALDSVVMGLIGSMLTAPQLARLGKTAPDWDTLVDEKYALMVGPFRPGHDRALRTHEVVETFGEALVGGLSRTLRTLVPTPFMVPTVFRENWNVQAATRALQGIRRNGAPSDTRDLDYTSKHAWSDAALDDARTRGDPEADFLILRLYPPPAAEPSALDTQNQADLNFALRDMVTHPNDPSRLPVELQQLRAEMLQRPSWVDDEKVEIAQQFFLDYGLKCIVALLTYGLPVGYGAAKGAEVLTSTGRLTYQTDLTRRIYETAGMVLYVLEPGGMEADGLGLAACIRVRLMHALIRQSLLSHRDHPWDTHYLGVPINQEDMAATILCFSYITLHGMDMLGVEYGVDEADRDRKREAWMHMWRWVGTLFGVEDGLLAKSFDEAEALWQQIERRQVTPSIRRGNQEGRDLTQALLGLLQRLGGSPLRLVAASFMHKLLGEDLATVLGVPNNRIADWVADLLIRHWDRTDADGRGARWLGRRVDAAAVRIVTGFLEMEHQRAGSPQQFEIPAHYQVKWKQK